MQRSTAGVQDSRTSQFVAKYSLSLHYDMLHA
jgi:hypothetical protein